MTYKRNRNTWLVSGGVLSFNEHTITLFFDGIKGEYTVPRTADMPAFLFEPNPYFDSAVVECDEHLECDFTTIDWLSVRRNLYADWTEEQCLDALAVALDSNDAGTEREQ